MDILARGKKGLGVLALGLLAAWGMQATPAFAVVVTTFDGSALDPEVQLDVPDTSIAQIVHGNGELRFSASSAIDMWDGRGGVPFAWTSKPTVDPGQRWFAETQVRFNTPARDQWTNDFVPLDPPYAVDEDGNEITGYFINRPPTYRIAGITFYGGPDGTGGSSGGMDFTFGLDHWDSPQGIWVQGLGDNRPGLFNTANLSAAYVGDSAYLRIEVTDNLGADSYSFFYKPVLEDSWVPLGSFDADFDNSRVALFLKANTDAVDQDASFTYFEVSGVPEPSAVSLLLVGLGGVLATRRCKKGN